MDTSTKTTQNKTHWYDGKFYDKFIAPNQDRLFNTIKNEIPKGSMILDVGCGTGRFSNVFKDHASQIKGIDLSIKNIEVAKQNLNGTHNVTFEHADAAKFYDGIFYDYTITTYVLHEMDHDDRIQILKNLKDKTNRLIIGEYLVPHPKSFWGFVNIIVEFLAGPEHYRNFKHFVKIGGVRALAEEAGYEIEKEILNKPTTSALYILKPKNQAG